MRSGVVQSLLDQSLLPDQELADLVTEFGASFLLAESGEVRQTDGVGNDPPGGCHQRLEGSYRPVEHFARERLLTTDIRA